MSSPQTIPRTATRRVAALRKRLTTCRMYTPDNCYQGEPVDPSQAWAALEQILIAELFLSMDRKSYIVHVPTGRNYWYALTED